jgi:hypothetical protein|tara:strand:- start:6717 stop:7196 length:480 start_codon:yes stop_codon:yes gene_type:complete
MGDIKFQEKQYLGNNKFNLFIRLIIAVACIGSYYSSDPLDDTAALFLIIGISVLVVSVILFLILHIKSEVVGDNLILDGFWTTRKVKIDLNNIVKTEVVKYSKILFNRPVYNLHIRGRVKFFTHGNWAVELTDKEGLRYLVGSQRVEELNEVIKGKIVL